ncbi:MAG: ATP-binding protein [Gammaproteobacteria bacterium]
MKIPIMTYFRRLIAANIQSHLKRGKSILLLGPRQTGKTTLIHQQIKPDIHYSFAQATTRLRYEQDPALLEKELDLKIQAYKTKGESPIIFIDEVQKIPRVMDIAQHLIDNKSARFILTGSSARKLKTGKEINLLPGRVVALTMTPLIYEELPDPKASLEEILLYGSLPGIMNESNLEMREIDLYSYVTTYLEEEIRAEAAVRNIGNFARFLEVAAGESGKQLNFTRLSQDIGISDTTVANYYQLLEDCLILQRVDPITKTQTKRRLIKSPKYLFFDLGIRRACANEGARLSQQMMGHLFEHYIGNALIWQLELMLPQAKVKYWRDAAGPEVDYVIEIFHQYIPIEVKWTEKPTETDAKYLKIFLEAYPETKQAYIVCRSPEPYLLSDKIMVLPWQKLGDIKHIP